MTASPPRSHPHRLRHNRPRDALSPLPGSTTPPRAASHTPTSNRGIRSHWHGLRGHQNCSLPDGSDMAGPSPDPPPPPDFPTYLLGTRPKNVQPALTPKCSQLRPHFPRFSPVSGSKQPQTSLLGTDANPCTRVKHQNQPQRRLRRVPDGLTRPLGGLAQPPKIACSHVAAMWLR